MSSDGLKPPPLIGDPARQAPDLHKGLVYQIWRSVEAWISLTDDELLFLEGAEDYDVVSNTSGTTVQVKATVGNITLRSEAVIAALNSFWLVKNNHPEKEIWFRFITTSSITTEQGNPFGNDAKGLELWESCARDEDLAQAEHLRNFLSTDPIVAPKLDRQGPDGVFPAKSSLLKYLQTAKPATILDELITHISWKTSSEDSDVVKENIAMHLRALGFQQRLRPSECEPANDHLFRIVAETASRKQGRVLSRGDLLLEFEQATSRRYSASEVAAFTASANLLQQAVSASVASGGDLILAASTLVQTRIPALPADYIKRTSLVAKVLAIRSAFGGVVIKGSSGMGKSTLAKLAATTAGGEWIWADFQGIDASNVPQMVRLFANQFIQAKGTFNLALDNLDFHLADLEQIENSLAAVVRSVRGRDGKFVITTQRDLPGRLLQKISLRNNSVFAIPYFTDAEIQEFCHALGCTNTEHSALLAKVVRVQTAGHPQLVHARLVGLASNSWPLPKAEDIITSPPEVTQALDIARQLLDEAPSDDKQLLYRLSITTGCFRRDHVLAIAQIEPSLGLAGDSFTRLVGPWIEVIGGEYYRLSALLNKAAERNWPSNTILSFRSGIAQAFLSCGKKSLLEANEILLQGLLAQDEMALTSVAIGLGSAPLNASPQIAEHFSWFTAFGHKNGKMIFPKNPFLNFLLRMLQFRIVVENTPDDADWLCEAIDRETANLDKELKSHCRIMWTTQAMISYQAKIRAKTLIGYWAETIDVLAVESSFAKLATETAEAMKQVDGLATTDFLGNVLLMILARDNNPEYLLELTQSVDALPLQKRDAAIGYMRQMPHFLQLAVDRSWLKESDKAKPHWDSALGCFDAMQKIAMAWKYSDFAALVYRAISVIQDEYLNHPDEAFEAAEKGIALASIQKNVLEDQKAMILYRHDNYAEALKIWERILATWVIEQNSHEMQPLFICQRAGNAAGHLQDWGCAIKFFQLGQHFAKESGSRLHELTFLGDEAHVEWKSGLRREALAKLASVVKNFEALKPEEDEELQFHRAWKSVEQVVKWCCQDSGVSIGVDTFEPPVGFCSKPESHEQLRNIPRAPLEFLWLLLAQLELQLGNERILFQHAKMRIATSQNAASRAMLARFTLTVIFRDRDFGSLVNEVLTFHKEFLDIPNEPAKPTSLSPMFLVEESLIAAFVNLAASEMGLDSFLPKWASELRKLSSDLESRIKEVLDSDRDSLYRIYKNTAQGRLVRMIAALRMAIDTDAELVSMFLGQASLMGGLTSGGFKNEASEAFGTIVKRTWQKRLRFPAEFPTPRITIRAIQAACEESVTGFSLAARILLQARFAVPAVRMPPEAIKQMEVLAS